MSGYKSPMVLVGSPEYHEIVNRRELGVLYLMLNLPTTCSLRCRKCALGGSSRESGPALSPRERAKVIANASLAGIKTLVIIGKGEPTENFSTMIDTISVASESGMGTIMFTTANRLDREQAEFYATHDVSTIVSLDSLDSETYRWLTGNGDLSGVLNNLRILREVYSKHGPHPLGKKKLVRLGINTTVCSQNVNELERIGAFAGEDMQFVANPPMRRGRVRKEQQWSRLVNIRPNTRAVASVDEYGTLQEAAEKYSSTGGHSSLTSGVCGYFHRGIGVDDDGEFLTCGYADETAGRLGNARNATPEDIAEVNSRVRAAYASYSGQIGYAPSCPVRAPDFHRLVELL